MENINEVYKARFSVMDIGAANPRYKRWAPYENCVFVGFEPNREEFLRLEQSTRKRFFNTAIYEYDGDVDLCITGYWSNISILRPNMDEDKDWMVLRAVSVPCRTIDSLCREYAIKPDFIKIDTQGTELAILRAGQERLRGVFGLELEVEFLELYKGQPLFTEVHSYLIGNDFQLMEYGNLLHLKGRQTVGLGGRKAHLVSGDALYFKTVDAVVEIARADKAFNLEGAIAVCTAYGYDDYAYEICLAVEKACPGDFAGAAAYVASVDASQRSCGARILRAIRGTSFARNMARRLRRWAARLDDVRHAHWFEGLGNR